MTRYALVPVEATEEMRLRVAGYFTCDDEMAAASECHAALIAASPGQGAMTAAQLEAAAVAIYEELEDAGMLRGEDEFPPWEEAPQDVVFLVRKLAKAALTCSALGLTVQP